MEIYAEITLLFENILHKTSSLFKSGTLHLYTYSIEWKDSLNAITLKMYTG